MAFQRRKQEMKFKFMAMAVALLMMAGFSLSSTAGSITDTDTDGVPDIYDNCSTIANGAAQAAGVGNQLDGDGDGYGNICDTDFDQDGATLSGDLGLLKANFGSANPIIDVDNDGAVLGTDLTSLKGNFGQAPGTSGIACADATIAIPGNPYAPSGNEGNGTDSACVATAI
jgi:hypothetical protein